MAPWSRSELGLRAVPILKILSPAASGCAKPFPEEAERSIRAASLGESAGRRALISASKATPPHCPTPLPLRKLEGIVSTRSRSVRLYREKRHRLSQLRTQTLATCACSALLALFLGACGDAGDSNSNSVTPYGGGPFGNPGSTTN